jgi:hypothetical protein
MYREPRVDAAVVQRLDQGGDGHFHDPDLGVRFFLAAAGQQPGEPRRGEAIREADAQLPVMALFRGARPGLEVLQKGQQAIHSVPVDLAGPGKPQVSGIAVEQVNLQPRFQFPEGPGKRPGFDVHPGRGAGETQFLGHRQEIA